MKDKEAQMQLLLKNVDCDEAHIIQIIHLETLDTPCLLAVTTENYVMACSLTVLKERITLPKREFLQRLKGDFPSAKYQNLIYTDDDTYITVSYVFNL